MGHAAVLNALCADREKAAKSRTEAKREEEKLKREKKVQDDIRRREVIQHGHAAVAEATGSKGTIQHHTKSKN